MPRKIPSNQTRNPTRFHSISLKLIKALWNPGEIPSNPCLPQGIHLPHRPQQRTNAATSDVAAAPQLLQQNCQKTATGHLSEAKIRWILPRKLRFYQKTKDFYLEKLFLFINKEILVIWQRNIWDLTGKNDKKCGLNWYQCQNYRDSTKDGTKIWRTFWPGKRGISHWHIVNWSSKMCFNYETSPPVNSLRSGKSPKIE